MPGYDILGDMGVEVPHMKVVPPQPEKSTLEFKIMKPVSRAPRPGPPLRKQPQKEPPRQTQAKDASKPVVPQTPKPQPTSPRSGWSDGATPTKVADLKKKHSTATVYSENGRTVYQVQNKGKVQEFEVYDSVVPCNRVYNSILTHNRSKQELLQRERESRRVEQEVESDRAYLQQQRQEAQAKKQREMHDLLSWQERKRALDKQKSAVDAHLQQHMHEVQQEQYERALHDKEVEWQRKQRSKEQWRHELNKLVGSKQERRAWEQQQKLKPDIDGFEIGLGHQVSRETQRRRGEEIRKAWHEQQQRKQDELSRERERDWRLYMQGMEAQQREAQHLHSEAVAKRERMRQMQEERKEVIAERQHREVEQRGREISIDRARAERDANLGARARSEERAHARSKSAAWKEELAKQIMQRAISHAERSARAPQPDLQHNGLGTHEPRKVLLRCPVTDQLLPPSAFNIFEKPRRRIIVD